MNYIINTNRNPYFNMSLDEYCLLNMDSQEPFFYLWQNDPTVVIGAHQNVYKEIDLRYLEENQIYLVRRMSGGGAVYHDKGNLNFTFIGKIEQGENEFAKYVGYVVEALREMGLKGVELSGRNDITMNGAKISGCAKRVFGNRCMVHGTLLYDVDTSVLKNVLNGVQSKMKLRGTDSVRKEVANIAPYLKDVENVDEFTIRLQNILSGNDAKEIILTAHQLKEVELISSQKYEKKDWVYGRKVKSNISYSHKFACGTVDVELWVEGDTINDIHFSGDFLGRERVVDIENVMKGLEYSVNKINECMKQFVIADYFDGMKEEEFVSFVFGR